MDIFKQRKFLIAVVTILILLNVGIITVLWMDQDDRIKIGKQPPPKPQEHNQISTVLKNELGFNEEQIKFYLEMRDNTRQEVERLGRQIKELKHQLFDGALTDNNDGRDFDKLLNEILMVQEQLERTTYQHFVDLKNLCNAEQKEKLHSLLDKLLPPPKEKKSDRPPHKKHPEPRPGKKAENRPPPPPPNQPQRDRL